MDFLTKELVDTIHYSDVKKDRYHTRKIVINGRPYVKIGNRTATSVIVLLYKVFNPSVEHSEYLALMGVARQNPKDINITVEEGYEVAYENALISPVATVKYINKPSKIDILNLIDVYYNTLPQEFEYTQKELLEMGEYVSKLDYYDEYYNGYKKLSYKYMDAKK